MKQNQFLILLLAFSLILVGYLYLRMNQLSTDARETQLRIQNCTPTFADGDGPYYYPNAPVRNTIVPDKNNGEKLIVQGRVYQNDCKTLVKNALLDVWQANERGEYQKDWYRGKVAVNSQGYYRFETVIPKGYGKGTAYRPPHIHFKVIINNQIIITSEMFFPDVKGREGFNYAYIMKLEKKNEWGKPVSYGYHDIILP